MTSPKVRNVDHRCWWLALVLGGVWLSIGCSPGMISYMLLPFVDNNLPPQKMKLATGKETTLVILSSFPHPEIRPELLGADNELAERLAMSLRKQFAQNKEKVKVVAPAKVRSYQNQNVGKAISLQDIGKHFEADYVVALEILDMAFYEKGSSHTLYRGQAELAVQVLDVHKPAGEGTVVSDPYRVMYPKGSPKDAGEMGLPQFRSLFLGRISRDLTRWFAAYPADQRFDMD